jgi:hypothetical protein
MVDELGVSSALDLIEESIPGWANAAGLKTE